ncbi:MAG: hypothetical protein ACKOW9_00065 [Candidatus Paceibacterota bacterium]
MSSNVQRHHWINTYLGILDAAFTLSEAEQAELIVILRSLLTALEIPKTEPTSLPAPVALEVKTSFYSIQLNQARQLSTVREVRRSRPNEVTVSPESWRDALSGMLLTAYPGLEPAHRLLVVKTFSDIILALGIPLRAAKFLPESVVRAYNSSPEAVALYSSRAV